MPPSRLILACPAGILEPYMQVSGGAVALTAEGEEMEEELLRFVAFLRDRRHMAQNTLVSYERDLRQLTEWLADCGVREPQQIRGTLLKSYILWLKKKGKAATTISRVIASMKAFFSFEEKEGRIRQNPAEDMKAPKAEKKRPTVLTAEEIDALLRRTEGKTPKKLRDRAMLTLLCATGLRVSEVISLKTEDVRLESSCVKCRREGERERVLSFGQEVQSALRHYLAEAREILLKKSSTDLLFVNVSGTAMSRQGFWKIIKYYGEQAGIRKDITPQTLRNSFAANMLSSGADIHVMQSMLGHSELSVTHAYVSYISAEGQRRTNAGRRSASAVLRQGNSGR